MPKNLLWHQTFSKPFRLYLWDANRLQPQSWITAEWGTSDNNRKAKFCSITGRGRRQLSEDAALLAARLSSVKERVLAFGSGSGTKG